MSNHSRQSSVHSRSQAIPAPSSPEHLRGRSPVGSPFQRETARLGSPLRASGSPAVRQIPTPGQLATGEPSEAQTPLPGVEQQSSLPGPGESALANALKNVYGNSPPRFGTPPIRPLSPAADPQLRGRSSPMNYGSFEPRSIQGELDRNSPAPYEDLEVVRRHLVGGGTGSNTNLAGMRHNRGGSGTHGDRSGSVAGGIDDDEFSSLQLQGGDITRQIYRYTQRAEEESQRGRRSRSFHLARPRPEDEELDINSIKQPGGFRRNYLRREASPSPEDESVAGPSNAGAVAARQRPRQPFTSNFIEFLSLYGHFAGEELEEDDEVLGVDEYFSSDAYETTTEGDTEREYGEDSALLTPATPGKRRRRRKERTKGKGGAGGAALLLLKSFVGTGVLFLPRAFLNGGMLFSNLVLLFVAGLSYYCFVLLVSTRLVVEHSFGDMGQALYGAWMRNFINFSLVISQIGFASAYIVFTSENLQAFILAVSNCRKYIDIKWIILMQMAVFMPLSLYRNINNIQKLALAADIFILLGLVYLYYYDIFTLASNGISDIVAFNKNDWTLFIGTAIFTFEGIGLIIPIQTGMKDPGQFPKVLLGVMIIITVVFTSMGALSYAAYGSATKTVVILNLPQDNKFVNGVQFIYSLAILLSTPLQIYPAIEITSQQLFSRTGKYNPYIKWKKNVFRFFMVMLCAGIAWAGANDLDKFVALVGSFACIPLVYIYPPMLHLKAISRTLWQRTLDIILCMFGLGFMAYTTYMTISSWASGSSAKPPGYCDEKRKLGFM